MATRDPLAPWVPGTPYDAMAAYTASQALIPSVDPLPPGFPTPNLPFGAVAGARTGAKISPDAIATQAYIDSMPPELAKEVDWLGNGGARSGTDMNGNAIDNSFLGQLAPILVEAGLAAVLGPELLAAFGPAGGVGAADAAATLGAGGLDLGVMSLPTWAAAPGLLASAETGAVLGAANSALTGQDIGKGALTGFAGGGLGSALGGVGKSISGAVGGGTIGDFLSKISTNAISQATMAGVQGKDVGKALESGALSGFFQTLSKDAIKAIVPDNTPGYLSSAAAGAVGGAITGAVKGQDPLASALGGAASSELGYQLSQLGSSAGLSNFEQQALSMALNAAMAKSPSKPTAPTAAKTVAPAATTTASTPPPAATATPTPVMHTTAPQAPTTNLGSTSSTPSSTINPTLSRALSREDSFGGNK